MARVAVILALWAAVGSAPAIAQNAAGRLLEVPYLSQTPDLCGGAAVAMVLRYWGAAATQPAEFAALVDHGAAGIPTDVLTSAVRARGWQSVAVTLDATSGAAWVRDHIQQGRPVVALIAVGPSRYHYVVVVASTARDIVVHDPARGPYTVLTPAAFDLAWAAAGRWALLILPGDRRPQFVEMAAPPPIAPEVTETACHGLVQTSVAVARAGDLGGAEAGLAAALHACPDDPETWRELAALRFLQARWADASALAAQAAALDPADVAGRELLATSRFMNDEPVEALAQWNRLGRPVVDVVGVEGARRTRHPDIAQIVDLPPLTLLTPARLARASRRLAELPSASATSLRYRPLPQGRARVEAVVVEPGVVPRGIAPWIATAARTWVQREARLDVVAPTGSGDVWTVAWRWWEARPRVFAAVTLPSPAWVPGITTLTASWERQTYQTAWPDVSVPAALSRRAHRRVSLAVADWATDWLRWDTALAFDRWADDRYVSSEGTVDARFAADRVSVGIATTLAVPLQPRSSFAVVAAGVAARSTSDVSQPRWSLDAGVEASSRRAPFDRWPGAGTGPGRVPLLRAHPLLHAGVVTGAMVGHRLVHATAEYQRPVVALAASALHLAAFVDMASVWQPLIVSDTRARALADAGVGARVVLPGRGGTLRVDLARGLLDRRMAVSAGWQAPWPGR